MPGRVITSVEQFQVAWFDEVLSRNGCLKRGGVENWEVQEDRGNWSEIIKIKLHYRAGSTGDLPVKLLLKVCRGGNSFGPSEVNY